MRREMKLTGRVTVSATGRGRERPERGAAGRWGRVVAGRRACERRQAERGVRR